MKKILFTVLMAVTLVLDFSSCSNGGGGGGGGGDTYTPGASPDTVSYASSDATTDYTTSRVATTLEQEVLDEMNLARTNPAVYITSRLQPELTNPNSIGRSSSTYLATVQELINEMQTMSDIGALTWSGRMKQSAMEWVTIQGAKNTAEDHGHDPNLRARIQKYCTSINVSGENLAYGYSPGRDIVIALLVDDKIEGRGHRYNILDYAPKGKNSASKFTHAGVACGSHGYYSIMCAINFAGTGAGFVEKP